MTGQRRLAKSTANAIREDFELVDVRLRRPARGVGRNDGVSAPNSNGERNDVQDQDRNGPAECSGQENVNESTLILRTSVPLNPRMYDHTFYLKACTFVRF